MHFFRKLFFILLTALSMQYAHSALLSISEQEINHYLQEKLTDKIKLKDKIGLSGLFQLEYHLKELSSQIGQTEEMRVALSGIIDASLKLKGKRYDTELTLNLDSEPYYDANQGALYLRDVRLIEWKSSNDKYHNELQLFLPILADGLSSFLNQHPIYTLNEESFKEMMIKKIAKEIVVEKGKLRLETGFFR